MKTIREWRETRGLSQFQLAVRAGVTPSSIHEWEFGKKEPGAVRLRQLAEALGVSMDDILIVRRASRNGHGK